MLWSVVFSLLLVSSVGAAKTAVDCARNGQCLDPGTSECADIGTVINKDTCNPKECQNKNGYYGFRYQESYKCTFTDDSGQKNCYKENETWKDGCLTRKCVKRKRNGRTYYLTKIHRYFCKDRDGTCHAWRSKWNKEISKNGCYELKCFWWRKAGASWPYRYGSRISYTKKACIDDNNKCQPVGSTGFTYTIRGRTSNDCSCIKKGKNILPYCVFRTPT